MSYLPIARFAAPLKCHIVSCFMAVCAACGKVMIFELDCVIYTALTGYIQCTVWSCNISPTFRSQSALSQSRDNTRSLLFLLMCLT